MIAATYDIAFARVAASTWLGSTASGILPSQLSANALRKMLPPNLLHSCVLEGPGQSLRTSKYLRLKAAISAG